MVQSFHPLQLDEVGRHPARYVMLNQDGFVIVNGLPRWQRGIVNGLIPESTTAMAWARFFEDCRRGLAEAVENEQRKRAALNNSVVMGWAKGQDWAIDWIRKNGSPFMNGFVPEDCR